MKIDVSIMKCIRLILFCIIISLSFNIFSQEKTEPQNQDLNAIEFSYGISFFKFIHCTLCYSGTFDVSLAKRFHYISFYGILGTSLIFFKFAIGANLHFFNTSWLQIYAGYVLSMEMTLADSGFSGDNFIFGLEHSFSTAKGFLEVGFSRAEEFFTYRDQTETANSNLIGIQINLGMRTKI